MRLFRRTRELSEQEMNEFIQKMAEQSEPRYGKRRDRKETKAEKPEQEEIRELYPVQDAAKEEKRLPAESSVRNLSRGEMNSFLEEQCEMIKEGSRQIEAVRKEYQEVTAYLQDTQLIERAGEEEKERIEDAARHILILRKDMDKLKRHRTTLTDFQYRTMERYEDIIPEEIRRLGEEEEYHALIKSDLQKLEGEKGALLYEEEELEHKRQFIGKMSIITGFVTVVLAMLYLYLWFGMKAAVTVPFLVTVGGAVVMAAYFFYESRHNQYARKLNVRKRNRLIVLQNRVKIKYVNNTASLDYSYEKYAVNNSRELRQRWEQYVTEKDEKNRKEQNREVLRYYEQQLFQVLDELGLHDSDIWAGQAEALLDQKEMVEIRHRLNVRRQKLRERLEYNGKLRERAGEELRQFRELYPQESERLQTVLASYAVTI